MIERKPILLGVKIIGYTNILIGIYLILLILATLSNLAIEINTSPSFGEGIIELLRSGFGPIIVTPFVFIIFGLGTLNLRRLMIFFNIILSLFGSFISFFFIAFHDTKTISFAINFIPPFFIFCLF